jgi:prolyl-tRNA editing enzyme YbaK/EbsC (Cys-tRNA(Pro) deacylase)
MEPLNPSAQKIQNLLRGLGFDYKVIEFTESTRTAQEAADRVGCLLGQIVKSLIFKGMTSNKGILVLTSGSNRADENKISQYSGESIGRADPEFVRTVTGFAIGGVPPMGHTQLLDSYIDEDLFQYTDVWAAAGTPNAVFQLPSSELVKISNGKIVRVKPG